MADTKKSKDIFLKFELTIEKSRFEYMYNPLKSELNDIIDYDPEQHDIQVKGFTISPAYNIKTISFLANYFNDKGESSDEITKKHLADTTEKYLNIVLSTKDFEDKVIDESRVYKLTGGEPIENPEIDADKKEDDVELNAEKGDKEEKITKTEEESKKEKRVKKIESRNFHFILDLRRLTITHTQIINRNNFEKEGKYSLILGSKDIAKNVDAISSREIKGWINGIELKPADEIEFFSRVFPQIKVEIDFK